MAVLEVGSLFRKVRAGKMLSRTAEGCGAVRVGGQLALRATAGKERRRHLLYNDKVTEGVN
jgi:hypothetical protein